MFTGLVEELGKVKAVARGLKSIRLTVAAAKVLDGVKNGDSIAVNGVCLTVTAFSRAGFTADVMPETVRRTSLAELKPGSAVNLERALRLGDRFGGHIVSGHIDGVGVIDAIGGDDNAVMITISAPAAVLRYIVPKGSAAIDGISLTVVDCTAEHFSVSIIPHTRSLTNLGFKKAGDTVNIETDVIGKYVEKLLGTPAPPRKAAETGGITADFLLQRGF